MPLTHTKNLMTTTTSKESDLKRIGTLHDKTEQQKSTEVGDLNRLWHRNTSGANSITMTKSEEKALVIQKLMTKINSPGGWLLGKNRQGQDIILSSVTEEDLDKTLVSVPIGTKNKHCHKKWRNTAQYAMQYLSFYHGHHNVGNQKAWLTSNELVRPQFDPTLYSEPFCDNIILQFSKEDGRATPILLTTQLLNWLGLKRYKQGSTQDKDISFHPSLVRKDEIKVSLANVSLLRLEILVHVMMQTLPLDHITNNNTSAIEKWFNSLYSKLTRLQETLTPGSQEDVTKIVGKYDILEATKIIHTHHIKLTEFDLTYDIAGTLNSEKLIKIAETWGHNVVKHRCGLNCVKMELQLPSNENVHSRTYNKWLETMQQGCARLNGISCKCALGLNPSTESLETMLNNPLVQQHGLTRNELTFFNPDIPSVSAMLNTLNHHTKMLKTVLVSASLHDQLSDMEKLVKRSVLVFWPEVLRAKLREFRREREQVTADNTPNEQWEISDSSTSKPQYQPEGGLVRWRNQLTCKYNGIPILTPMTGRASAQSSWTSLVNLAALATTCANDPVLFLGVHGHEQYLCSSILEIGRSESVERSTHLWFLPLDIKRVGDEMAKTYLPFHSDCKTSNFKNRRTDFTDVGINLSELTNFRPTCFGAGEPIDYSHIKLDIRLPEKFLRKELSVLDVDSITHEQGLGCPRTYIFKGDELKNLPSEFTIWDKCVKKKCGPVEKVDFFVDGAWFRVPRAQEKEILTLLKQDPDIKCRVKKKTAVGGLDYQICQKPTETTVLRHSIILSGSKSSKLLPVQDEAMTIICAQYDGKTLQVQLEGIGSFYIPKSIVDQIKDIFGEQQNLRTFLATELLGYKILHNESIFAHVKGNSNKEEHMSVLSRSSQIIAKTAPVTMKRAAASQGGRQALKKQRSTSTH
jgi:hypothetical protein